MKPISTITGFFSLSLVAASPVQRFDVERRASEGRPRTLLEMAYGMRNPQEKEVPLGELEIIKIFTWVHVFTLDPMELITTTNEVIHKQMEVLNTAFSPGKIYFELVGIGRGLLHDHEGFGRNGSEKLVKRLRKGDKGSLNLIFTDRIMGSSNSTDDYFMRGFTIMPGTSKDYSTDYTVVHLCSLYGRSCGHSGKGVNLGRSAVHEVGHWLGLLHVYGGDGDFVDDTPPESTSYGQVRVSVTGRNCAGPLSREGGTYANAGNIMTNAPDLCRWFFTEGQFRMMRRMWSMFRANTDKSPSHN
ncbi:hypothetical protein XA68_11250 [Ophiocordyceps unilateralis]|uniref:Peptidase M43 pregnancy-associated plasma-A domain-containing protein n=1 Tax=Ophiocordyceps unilateralis TaxID=268505 RepID=A0A2A9PH88_OPHUN|nr:hypothetical protein XA68_11250 [Ophiocordyceps unilateralis]